MMVEMDSGWWRVRADVHPMGRFAVVLFALILVGGTAAAATMPLSEVRKGMKGYGVTVFEDGKLEKFDVEIVGVLHKIGPDQDLILATADSPQIRRAGIIAGMSGSPVYIDGKIVGALAYAFQFAKEPIFGITPIDEMLKIAEAGSGSRSIAAAAPRMTGSEFLNAVANGKTEGVFDKLIKDLPAQQTTIGGARKIALPLSMTSFAPETLARFGGHLSAMNFVAVPAGGAPVPALSGAEGSSSASSEAPFQPGDPVGAVLLNGDFSVAATGTVTHIDGGRVYAFGHPFLDFGEINFPMAKAEIIGFMPSLASSFKFSNTGAVVGAFRQDRSPGILGNIGEQSNMIPVELTVDGSGTPKKYKVNVVRHPQLSPLMLAMAADSVVANSQRAAGERTVVLDSEIKIKGFDPIRLREGWAGAQARQAIPAYLAVVSGYLMSNEFRDAEIESVKVHVRHDDELKIARLVEATIETPANGRISPGDTVKVRTLLKPFRGDSFVETFEVKIPDNQQLGSAYLLVGSGTVANQIDFTLVPPDPRTLEHVVGVLQRLRPSTDLTVGLYSSGDGAVTAGVYLHSLPPSMRAVVMDDTSNGPQAPVRFHAGVRESRPLGYIVDGAVKIDLTVRPAI
jgi:hypothetical protein